MDIIGKLDNGKYVVVLSEVERTRLELPLEAFDQCELLRTKLFLLNDSVKWSVQWENCFGEAFSVACVSCYPKRLGAFCRMSRELVDSTDDLQRVLEVIASTLPKKMSPLPPEGQTVVNNERLLSFRVVTDNNKRDILLGSMSNLSGATLVDGNFTPIPDQSFVRRVL